ncbi:MAG TPA: alpha/beta fold hydrolase [Cyclobacteriaceae bacterium]
MKLFYRSYGTSGDLLIILHGIFGSSDNWHSLSKKFGNDFKVLNFDLRNHGNSPHSDEFNYELMVEDVIETLKELKINKINIIGHSMGGKVAMLLAVSYPQLIDKLIVVDISPRYYPIHHREIINAMKSLRLNNIETRSQADEQLKTKIPDFGTRQFILKNLQRNNGNGFSWKLNLESIDKNLENIGEPLPGKSIFNGTALFVRGGQSDYIQDNDLELIEKYFPDYNLETVNKSGHWVHAEQPVAFYNRCQDFLKS